MTVPAWSSPTRCLVLRSSLPLCVLAALLLTSGSRPRASTIQTGHWFAPELNACRVRIDAYREDRVEGAIDGVLACEVEAIHEIVDAARNLNIRLTGTDREPALHEQLFRAALAVTADATEAALRSRY